MLLEECDHPPVSIAAICTNIHSPIKLAQFIGRAQRVMSGEKDVVADVSHWTYIKFQKNYDNFEYKWLIPPTEVEADDQEAQ